MPRNLVRIYTLPSQNPQTTLCFRVQPSHRTFHAAPQHRFLDTCFEQTYTLLNGVHTDTGLPWAATLPLAGLGVRLLLVAPFSFASDNIARRRLALQPLRHAWGHHLKGVIFKQYAVAGPKACHRALARALGRKSRELDQRMGTQMWKGFLHLAQIPIFLVVIETIRKMSGVHDGLLGLIAKSLTRTYPGDEPSGGPELIQDLAVPVVRSFAEEGALWFPNLLVPDPISVLPFLLSATILVNIHLQRRQAHGVGKWSRRYFNIMTTVGFMIGPLTMQLPAAMHIYWLSTSTFAIGQNLVLHKYFPRLSPVQPCAESHKRAMLSSTKPMEVVK
jgi:mitochondrial inner membrane protein COX18